MPDALENLNYILENVEDFNIMSFSKNITYHYKDYPSFLAGWTHIGKYDGKFYKLDSKRNCKNYTI